MTRSLPATALADLRRVAGLPARPALALPVALLTVAGGVAAVLIARAATLPDEPALGVLHAARAVAAFGAFAAVLLAARGAEPVIARFRRRIALALLATALGEATFIALPAGIPWLVDAVWVGALVWAAAALGGTVAAGLRTTTGLGVLLSAVMVGGAVVAPILLLVGLGPGLLDGAHLPLAVYALLELGLGAAALAAVVLVEHRPRILPSLAMFGGMGLLGLTTLAHVLAGPAAEHVTLRDGRLDDVLVELALLLIGLGGATFTLRPGRRVPRGVEALRNALPLVGGATTCAMAGVAVALDPVTEGAILATAGLTILAAFGRGIARDADQRAARAELDRRQARLEAALERSAAAEREQRTRARLLARVLAASEGLSLAVPGAVGMERALASLVPVGATAVLGRLEPDGDRLAVVAAHGPGSTRLLGRVTPVAALSAPLRRLLADGRTIALPPDPDAPARAAEDAGPWVHAAEPGPLSVLVLPLLTRSGAVLGVLQLTDPDPDRILEPTFADLARLLANQLAVAVENERLHEALRQRLEERQRTQPPSEGSGSGPRPATADGGTTA